MLILGKDNFLEKCYLAKNFINQYTVSLKLLRTKKIEFFGQLDFEK